MNHRSLRKRSGIQILAPLAGILATGAAGAAEVTLPPTVAVSIGVIAGADPIVTALAGALKKNFGTTLDMRLAAAQGYTNVLPMVRDGQVTFAGNSVLAQPYAASEGLAPMDVPSWGPQRLGVVFACRMGVNSIATAADANIRTYAALKGKRIALPPGMPRLGQSPHSRRIGRTVRSMRLMRPRWHRKLWSGRCFHDSTGECTSQRLAHAWTLFPNTCGGCGLMAAAENHLKNAGRRGAAGTSPGRRRGRVDPASILPLSRAHTDRHNMTKALFSPD
jgi:hypothetical protein